MQKDIRAKIKSIKLATKRLMQTTLSGDYLSAFKGAGMEFDQLREYQPGDDVRLIDWYSSVKTDKIMVKQFIEERDRRVIIMADISGSSHYSSTAESKRDIIVDVATALAFIGTENKDRVGLLLFTDRVERWLPPKRGNVQLHQIMEALLSCEAAGKGTDIGNALRFLLGLKQRNAIVFMLSDWIDEPSHYEKMINVARCKYDCVAMRFLDHCEQRFPAIGIVEVQDSESGNVSTLPLQGQNSSLNDFLQERYTKQAHFFKKRTIDFVDFTIGKPFVQPLIQFFHRRIRRSI